MTRYLRVYDRRDYPFVLIDERKLVIISVSPIINQDYDCPFRLFQEGARESRGIQETLAKDEGVQSVTPLAFFMVEE
jgi:hypothetical protein